MRKTIPGLIVLAFVTGCGSSFDYAMESLEEKDFKEAIEWLSEVKENDKMYDSAQVLLGNLPDSAFTYYIALAESSMVDEEFSDGVKACDKAIEFKPDTPTVAKLRNEIIGTGKKFWLKEGRAQLNGGNFKQARKAYDEIYQLDSESKAGEQLLADIERAEKKEKEKELLEIRKTYAKEYEKSLLREGFNVTVSIYGNNYTTLKLKWILVDKSMSFQLSEDKEFINGLRSMGFKKFVLSDGYSETWTIDLD